MLVGTVIERLGFHCSKLYLSWYAKTFAFLSHS